MSSYSYSVSCTPPLLSSFSTEITISFENKKRCKILIISLFLSEAVYSLDSLQKFPGDLLHVQLVVIFTRSLRIVVFGLSEYVPRDLLDIRVLTDDI